MKKVTKKKEMTIDDLALMTQRGFGSVDKRLDSIDIRLDRIENLLIRAHDNRLDKLDDQMRRVITIFEKKLSIPFSK